MADLPERVEEAETLSPGRWTLDLGMIYRDEPQEFGVPDRDAQLDLGQIRFSFGLGRMVEFQLTGVAVSIIKPFGDEDDLDLENNSGDWEFATKVWILSERGWLPNVSFYYSVKLPNASNEKGSGTDETDFSTFLRLDKTLKSNIMMSLNLGIGILGDPFTNAAQNDVFTYGLAVRWEVSPDRRISLNFGGETGPRLEDDPQGLLLTYTQRLKKKWAWYVGAAKGFKDDTDNYFAQIGFRRTFNLKKTPTRKRYHNW